MKRLISALIFVIAFQAAHAQSERLKDAINNLAYFNTKKDLKFLGEAKKAVDKSFYSEKDTANVEKNVYRVAVYSSILYVDTNNVLAQPDTFLRYTTRLLRSAQNQKKVFNYQSLVDYSKRCLSNAYLRKGTQSYKSGDYAASAAAYVEAKNLYADIPFIDAYLARAYEKAGKGQIAADTFDELTKKDNAPLVYYQSAVASYLTEKDTAKALSVIKKGRRTFSQDTYLLTQEANIYNNRRDYPSLKSILNDIVKLNPNDEKVIFMAANCLDHLNDYDGAASFYSRLTELNTNAFSPVLNAGFLYLRKAAKETPDQAQKSVANAQIWLERANELNPDDVNCLKGLQMVYEQTRNQYQLKRVNTKLRQVSN